MDDRLGYHTVFQMVLPEIMLSAEKILAPIFEFICRCFNLRDSVHRVPLSFRYPGEEDATMTTSVNPQGAQWGYFFPKKMKEYFEKYVLFENLPASEIAAWKEAFVFLLKKISLANHNKQLVLKSPPNTARIKLLLTLFPNAKFIFIHRNPYDVYVSNKRFLKVTQKIYALGTSHLPDMNSIIVDTYSKMMHRYLLEKDMIPAGHLIEIPYIELIQHPMESMRKIYNTIQLDDFDYCQDKMKSFVEKQQTFIQLKHELPAEEKKVVTQRLEPFIKKWNYPLF
jgi:hypothetical protein